MNNEIKKMMSELHLNYPVNLLPHVVTARVQTLVESDEYNISLLNIPEAWKETQGEGIKVAVLDAGRPNHPDLVIAGSKSFVPGYDEDKCGHDTHVCGIIRATAGNGLGIRGIAPLCDIYAGVVLGAEGSGELDWIVKGIYWAVDEVKADIIVIGSHSRKWLENIVMGSVTEKVLNHTSVPLFIVPTKKQDEI